MRRRRVTYRPSKAQGAFGVAVGAIFVVIGLVMVIPIFGLFGVLWTLIAVGITGMNAYQVLERAMPDRKSPLKRTRSPVVGHPPPLLPRPTTTFLPRLWM